MKNISTNITIINEISLYDTSGAIIYIFSVLIWYAFGFGLILINNIYRGSNRNKSSKYTNVYQTVNDLHEQKKRNDILIELKDIDRRKKLWKIYYGTEKNSSKMIEKDNQTVDSIIKQLNESNERRRLLRNTLYDISIEQSDDDDDDETKNNHTIQLYN